MPSRSTRRQQHKRLSSLGQLDAPLRSARAARWLAHWRAEAYRRARHLGALAAWQLAADPHIRALVRRLDPSGELYQDLRRVCAEAVAAAADPRLAHRGRRPDSARRRERVRAGSGAPRRSLEV